MVSVRKSFGPYRDFYNLVPFVEYVADYIGDVVTVQAANSTTEDFRITN